MKYYIGFDLGGSTVKYGLINENGQIIDKGFFNTPTERASIIAQMEVHVIAYQSKYQISGVGISAPGIVKSDGFLLTGGAISDFYNYDLAHVFEKVVRLPVIVENDANSAAIAEHWLGNAKDYKNYVCVVIGTGVGSGIIINEQVYRGAHGMAGEVGWGVINDFDKTHELENDSLNHRVSTVGGLVNRYNASLRAVYPDADIETDARKILDLAWQGDRIALPVLREFEENLSLLCINLFSFFDPEMILIGGAISANSAFINDFQVTLREFIHRHRALDRIYDTALGRVQPAGLRNDAGLIGAVYPFVFPNNDI